MKIDNQTNCSLPVMVAVSTCLRDQASDSAFRLAPSRKSSMKRIPHFNARTLRGSRGNCCQSGVSSRIRTVHQKFNPWPIKSAIWHLLLFLSSIAAARDVRESNNISFSEVEVTASARQLTSYDNLNATEALVFAVIPKTIDNTYFHPVERGCKDEAARLQNKIGRPIVCNFTGPNNADPDPAGRQRDILLELLDSMGNNGPTRMSIMSYKMSTTRCIAVV